MDDAINALWEARQRFAWDPFIRTELGRILREHGDLTAAEGVLREAVSHFPSDIVCRTGLADLLIDLYDVDAAERLYREALEINEHNQYARGGLARSLAIRSARTRNEELRDEAKRILQELADEGNQDAKSRLRDFEDQWVRATTDPSITFRRETEDRKPQARQKQQERAIAEMSVAERLGRAMITLWQAERAGDVILRSSLCVNANALLDVPEDKIDDDLLAAFVETRGLVLLASGDAQSALAYFEEQISHYGRGGWIGVRLGEQRASILLGKPVDIDDTAEPLNSQSARFALHVARVIQTLSVSPQESAVRILLQSLYPEAAMFAARPKPDKKGELSFESGAETLGAFLQTRWFRPAGIQSAEDLDRPDALQAVMERINNTRTDTFDVISNSTLALAA